MPLHPECQLSADGPEALLLTDEDRNTTTLLLAPDLPVVRALTLTNYATATAGKEVIAKVACVACPATSCPRRNRFVVADRRSHTEAAAVA